MNYLVLDTETARIRPGLQVPPIVCFQWTAADRQPEILHARVQERYTYEWARWALHTNDILLVGHNVAYEMAGICEKWPDLVPAVFQAYLDDRVVCTIVREKLHDIELGIRRGKTYNMGDVCDRRGITPGPDKNDPWRLRYWELRDTPVDQWPAEAKKYALDDAHFTEAIYTKQSDKPDQFRQTRADFWLSLTSAWGLRTKHENVQRFYEITKKELEEERKQLQNIGLVRHDGSRDTKAARNRMAAVCHLKEIDPPLTATGQISLSAEATEDSDDPYLKAYSRYTSHGTIMSRIKRLFHGTRVPIQSSFDSLVETGRTSCRQGDVKPGKEVTAYGFQLQNPNRAAGMRECFIARDGMCLIATDYDKCELHTVSQVNVWMHRELGIPESEVKLAQQLNKGFDPHLALGAQILGISYDDAKANKKRPDVKEKRQMSKAANFGFPGGLGITSFIAYAKNSYKVIFDEDPVVAEQMARQLKNDWLTNYPEFNVYFRIVRNMLRPVGKNDDGSDKLRATVVHPLSHRTRGNVPFTVACNSYFQGLAADLAKDAGFRVAFECYAVPDSPLFGWRIVNFVHDELIIEGPRETCHEAAVRMKQLMEDAGREWCPDVPVKASPAVMYQWSKAAEDTICPTTGRYIPFEEMPGYDPDYLKDAA